MVNADVSTQKREPKVPAFLLTDPEFVWVPSGKTDVQRTWRKHGWVPPSELKEGKHDAK